MARPTMYDVYTHGPAPTSSVYGTDGTESCFDKRQQHIGRQRKTMQGFRASIHALAFSVDRRAALVSQRSLIKTEWCGQGVWQTHPAKTQDKERPARLPTRQLVATTLLPHGKVANLGSSTLHYSPSSLPTLACFYESTDEA